MKVCNKPVVQSTKPISKWSAADVVSWVQSINMGRYVENFSKQLIKLYRIVISGWIDVV